MELNPTEQAGKDAVDCIMPGMIAADLDPSSERLLEISAEHLAKHWQELDDDGKLAAFTYLAAVTAQIASQRVKQALSDFVAGSYDEPFTAAGWPIRTDGGI